MDPLTMSAFWVPVHHMMLFFLRLATVLNHFDRLVLLLRAGWSFVLQLANCEQTSWMETQRCERPVCPPAAVMTLSVSVVTSADGGVSSQTAQHTCLTVG